MKDVPFHEAADIFPLMTGDDFDGLVEDIRKRGQMCPIETLDAKIIDGRNRYRACLEVPCDPDIVEVDGLPEAKDDPIAYVVSLNLHRRHLTPSQCAIASGKAEKASGTQEKLAKERQKQSGKTHGRGQKVVANCPQAIEPKARDQAGKAFGISGKTHDAGVKVLDKGSAALVKAVESGEVSVSAAAKVADLPKAEQNAAVKAGKAALNQAAKKVTAQKATDGLPSGKTPHQQAEEDPQRRWSAIFQKIYMVMNSTRDLGGIDKLAKKWTTECKQRHVVEVKRIIGVLSEWVKILEK